MTDSRGWSLWQATAYSRPASRVETLWVAVAHSVESVAPPDPEVPSRHNRLQPIMTITLVKLPATEA
jgi:hypothetical protein